MERIEEQGARLVAVSPQLPELNRKLVSDKKLRFTVLSDRANAVAREYGLVYTLPEELRNIYLDWGVDLEKFNDDASWTLPMPGRFIIDESGVIRSAEAHPDYTVRPEPSRTLEELQALVFR